MGARVFLRREHECWDLECCCGRGLDASWIAKNCSTESRKPSFSRTPAGASTKAQADNDDRRLVGQKGNHTRHIGVNPIGGMSLTPNLVGLGARVLIPRLPTKNVDNKHVKAEFYQLAGKLTGLW